ncbi:hypothetical protein BV898_02894 [Hypsibius exemplaris]|uniref:Glycine N-acyltransferase-like protein n=1 Tax=Hypsibius exemplaris TaxID=2072580 RepID=A0A1W0X704_HYPEX|nr:hypothetical protein BV898_02894 [Hypsibius exemplaris]
MHIIEEEELGLFVEELKSHWPETLPIYYLAQNHLLKNQFAWPGIEFVVDCFPNHKASIARPKKNQNNVAIPPRFMCHTAHTFFAINEEALGNLLQEPGVVDWSKPTFFYPVSRSLYPKLAEICRVHGSYMGHEEREDLQAFVVVFRHEKLNPGPPLPEGFTLKPLERHHLETVASIWAHGGRTRATLEYMQYLFDTGFPTLGIFNPDGKLAAYAITGADFVFCAAYVFPEYRNHKLFHILTYEWCQIAHKLGVELPFALVSEQNVPSHKALFRVGADRAGWDICYGMYVPKGHEDPDDELIQWRDGLGGIVWKT